MKLSTLLAVYGPACVILLLTAVLSQTEDVALSVFLRDPVSTLGGHPLTGVQSHLGVLLWAVTAGICAFTWARLGAGDRRRSFFMWSAQISAILALDDLFLIHEDLAGRYLGIPETVVLAVYALVLVGYFVRFRNQDLVIRERMLLLLAALFFGLSTVVDFAQDQWASSWRIFFEDGFKLLGIVSWSGYLVRACFHSLASKP